VAAPDWLYLDSHAGISQQNISAFGPQLIDPAQITGNSSTVRTLSLSPYLQHEFSGLAKLLARYDYGSVRSSNLLQVRSGDALLQLTGLNNGRGWNWDLRLQRQHIDDAKLPAVTMDDAALTLSYPLNSRLSLSGTGGYERNDYQTLGDQPRGRYWNSGLLWTPSPRTSLSMNLGRRYFGKTYGLNASYRLRRMFWTLNYSEDITTTNGQFLAVPPAAMSDFLFQLWESRISDPELRRAIIQAFVSLAQMLGPAGNVNYFSHRYYLQRQWQFSTVYSGTKSTWSLGINSTGRTSQSNSAIDSALLLGPTDIALQDRTRQTTLQAGWNWRLNARSNFNLSASKGVAESISTGRKDHNAALVLGLTRQLGSKASLSADLRHSRHSSNAGGDYRENGISATLSMQF